MCVHMYLCIYMCARVCEDICINILLQYDDPGLGLGSERILYETESEPKLTDFSNIKMKSQTFPQG